MQAFALHRAGELAKAEPLYKDVLRAAPKHFDALHMLGIVHLQTGRSEEALRLIKKAVAVNPKDPVALNNQGNTQRTLRRYRDAIASYDLAMSLKPDYDEAFKNKGDVLQILGRHDEALISYSKALRINPNHAELHNNSGVSLFALGRYAEAVEAYNKAAALNPRYAPAFSNRADALRMLGRYDEALESFRQALVLAPVLVEALANYGNTLREMRRYDEALVQYDKVLAIDPQHIKTLNNRGAVLRDTLRFPEALESLDKALTLKPDYTEALINRGTVLHEYGRDDEAVASFDKALALDPDYAEGHWNKALALLTQGKLAEGWPEFEWRWKSGGFRFPPRGFTQPTWRGEDLAGGMLLVWGEQGIGDEVLYGGMAADLAERGLALTWEADKRLMPLIARSYPKIRAVARSTPPGPATVDPAIKAQISTASLGQYLRRDGADFPKARTRYLKADEARTAGYRARLLGEQATRLIGVSWISQNPDFGVYKTTALPAWAPIWQAAGPNVRFVDLQYGDTTTERAAVALDLAHLDDLDVFHDIDGLAALIAACDLVITVSNTTAHLAGALGVPVWVMVSSGSGKLWYWGGETNSSPWYPTMRLFRQRPKEDWGATIASIAGDVTQSLGV